MSSFQKKLQDTLAVNQKQSEKKASFTTRFRYDPDFRIIDNFENDF